MKGVVLAAGAGTRLRPLTHTGPKHLVPIANRPILFYVLDTMRAAGIREIAIVVSPEAARAMQHAVGDGSAWGARVTFVVQSRPAGVPDAIAAARAIVGDDDLCVMLGDNVLGAPIGDVVGTFASSTEIAASILLKEVPDPTSFGVAEVDGKGDVVRLVEKPKEPPSNLALVGVFLLRPSIFEVIERLAPSSRGELEMTDAINALIARGARVRGERLSAFWLDTGRKDDLLLANDTALDAWLVPEIRGSVDGESRLSGPVRVEEGASIVRSTVRGPVVVGRGARIVDAAIGPHTSLGDRVVVARAGVARSVILEESRIEGVSRLFDSLVGRRVVVSAGAGSVDAVSLLVGDDGRIDLGAR